MLSVLIAAAALFAPIAAPPSSVALVHEFDSAEFNEPEAVLWPAYFWLWNAPLREDKLRAQLEDMASHDARSVCLLPMPKAFRPDSTNNSLDPDYLSDAYFEHIRQSVDTAAALKMNWWLYDEGGWPSGQAIGHVTDGHPELAQQRLVREAVPATAPYLVPNDALALVVESPSVDVLNPGETWTPSSPDDKAFVYRVSHGGYADLLNPATTQRFIDVTHEGYARVASNHFGDTIRFVFTDEPSVAMPRPPDMISWTPGLDQLYQAQYGIPLAQDLPALFVEPNTNIPQAIAEARIRLYDLLTQRFRDAYFGELQTWSQQRNLASGGHIGGEDETLGAIRYGFGHLLRQLRRMDVPGVDLIWRQVFPGRENQSNFPVAASSVAHQNGTRFAFTESFCVYGNGLTPAEMKWLTDYQYIRGLNLMVIGCYPYSTEDHHMTGERPHYGAMNPLWDHLPGYHAYTARLGYLMSLGKPDVRVALYYPSRDMWAWGMEATAVAESFDAVQQELVSHQIPYDWVDDDGLLAASINDANLNVGAASYNTIVCGDVRWMHPDALAKLQTFAQNGGKVVCLDNAPGTIGMYGSTPDFVTAPRDVITTHIPSPLSITPTAPDLRVAIRAIEKGHIAVLFNEGNTDYTGAFEPLVPNACELNLETGARIAVPTGPIALTMPQGQTRAYLFTDAPLADVQPAQSPADVLTIAPESIVATRGKQIVVGKHDFANVTRVFGAVPFAQSARWADWLSADYSGEVDYQFEVEIPATWEGGNVELSTGPIEYAATVYVDDVKVGHLLWAPWTLPLTITPGKHTLKIRVANTLANELTSARVTEDWSKNSGPGWPSPYHVRAIEFEKETRGGGITGPVKLIRKL